MAMGWMVRLRRWLTAAATTSVMLVLAMTVQRAGLPDIGADVVTVLIIALVIAMGGATCVLAERYRPS
jgi:hypothetical protein